MRVRQAITAMRKSSLVFIIFPFCPACTAPPRNCTVCPKVHFTRQQPGEFQLGLKGEGAKAMQCAKGAAFTSLKAGKASKTLLDIGAPGMIQRMWFTFDNRSPEMLRSLRLTIYWDGNNQHAVDVPFGDFFCANLGRTVPFQSALFSNPEGRSFNCYIPMPFRSGAKVVLTNDSGKDLSLLFFDIDFIEEAKAEPGLLYFHACSWHRQRDTIIGKDIQLLPENQRQGPISPVSARVSISILLTAIPGGAKAK